MKKKPKNQRIATAYLRWEWSFSFVIVLLKVNVWNRSNCYRQDIRRRCLIPRARRSIRRLVHSMPLTNLFSPIFVGQIEGGDRSPEPFQVIWKSPLHCCSRSERFGIEKILGKARTRRSKGVQSIMSLIHTNSPHFGRAAMTGQSYDHWDKTVLDKIVLFGESTIVSPP